MPVSEEEAKEAEEETEEENEQHSLLGYIVIGCSLEGEMFVSVQFADGQELKIAELMFILISGQAVEEAAASLRKACRSDEQAQFILQTIASKMQTHAAEQMLPYTNRPVVDPTEVFNRREKDEFKG